MRRTVKEISNASVLGLINTTSSHITFKVELFINPNVLF